MWQKLFLDLKPRMEEIIARLDGELHKLHTGRANPALLEGIKISYYGASTPLKQAANLTVPQANQILITPWDKALLAEVERAIRDAGLGVSVANDGEHIRVTLPALTAERREELVRLVYKIAEEARIVLRNLRREAWDAIQDATQKGEVREDERERKRAEIDHLIEEMNDSILTLVKQKESEIRTI